jgi:hypothetical protein
VGLVDFLQDWSIATIILAAVFVATVAIAGSYGLATAWRRWKEAKRARSAAARRGAHGPTGTSFAERARLTKLPKPALGLKRPSLGKVKK